MGVPVNITLGRLLGARPRRRPGAGTVLKELSGAVGHFAVTMADPEGNEFCVT